MVILAMTDDGIVRFAAAKNGEAGIGIASLVSVGDRMCYRFALESEREAEDFALRKNAWAGHSVDRAYAPVVPEYVDGEAIQLMDGFYVHFWGLGLKSLHFDALRPGLGGPRRTIVGKLDCDGSLFLAAELPDQIFVGFTFNLRTSPKEVECFRPIASDQEAWTFAVDRRPPNGATAVSVTRPTDIKLLVGSMTLGIDCVRFVEGS